MPQCKSNFTGYNTSGNLQNNDCKIRKGESVGNDLRSHAATRILPSVLVGLTAGFEMGPGVPPPLLSPTHSVFHDVWGIHLSSCELRRKPFPADSLLPCYAATLKTG